MIFTMPLALLVEERRFPIIQDLVVVSSIPSSSLNDPTRNIFKNIALAHTIQYQHCHIGRTKFSTSGICRTHKVSRTAFNPSSELTGITTSLGG